MNSIAFRFKLMAMNIKGKLKKRGSNILERTQTDC